MTGIIYKITNDINNKVYIGKTLSSIEKRFQEHKNDAKREEKSNRPLYRAIRKYGIEHFFIEEIGKYPLDELEEKEIYWINYFQSYSNGYNATLGGDGKQIFDYDAIVQSYLSGKLVQEVAEEFNCCPDTVCAALKLAKIDSHINANKKLSKKIVAKTLEGDYIKSFDSQMDAARWLQKNNYTQCLTLKTIANVVGRVANGKRKNAYGLKWQNE